jgi:hypothetical protein
MSDSWIDGNVLGGALGDVFAVDLSTAVGRCAGCGRVGVLAEARVYESAGLVARCPGCESVLVRVVRAPERVFLDLHGLTRLELHLS